MICTLLKPGSEWCTTPASKATGKIPGGTQIIISWLRDNRRGHACKGRLLLHAYYTKARSLVLVSVDKVLTFLLIPLLLFVDLLVTQLADACAAATTSTGLRTEYVEY